MTWVVDCWLSAGLIVYINNEKLLCIIKKYILMNNIYTYCKKLYTKKIKYTRDSDAACTGHFFATFQDVNQRRPFYNYNLFLFLFETWCSQIFYRCQAYRWLRVSRSHLYLLRIVLLGFNVSVYVCFGRKHPCRIYAYFLSLAEERRQIYMTVVK